MGRIAICQKCIAEIKQTYGSYEQNHDEWVFGNEVYPNIGSLLLSTEIFPAIILTNCGTAWQC